MSEKGGENESRTSKGVKLRNTPSVRNVGNILILESIPSMRSTRISGTCFQSLVVYVCREKFLFRKTTRISIQVAFGEDVRLEHVGMNHFSLHCSKDCFNL